MSDFFKAVDYVLANEGGLTNDPVDPGGITNYGITLPVLREMGVLGDVDHDGDVDPDDIRKLTREQAIEVYLARWWGRFGYGRIGNQAIATKVFDLAVNFGATQAHIIVQRACNRQVWKVAPLKVDGIIGAKTFAALNAAIERTMLDALQIEAAKVYLAIVDKKPALGKFLLGWMRRALREPAA